MTELLSMLFEIAAGPFKLVAFFMEGCWGYLVAMIIGIIIGYLVAWSRSSRRESLKELS